MSPQLTAFFRSLTDTLSVGLVISETASPRIGAPVTALKKISDLKKPGTYVIAADLFEPNELQELITTYSAGQVQVFNLKKGERERITPEYARTALAVVATPAQIAELESAGMPLRRLCGPAVQL